MPWSAESSDEELMLLYRDGNAGAFDVLYRRHKGGLYRYLLRQCRDPAAAEELRRLGQKAEAETMLAEFKRRFPEHPLPPGLR